MCGIAGIISLENNNLDTSHKKQLDILLNSMIHRGPDDLGVKYYDKCIFGMRRLSIIDLKFGNQPISNKTNTIWTVFNGEIYNYLELRKNLIYKGYQFKTNSDTEVIVHLYEEHGEKFVNFLNGMFAIFIYDINKKKVLLFRDHMGIKPLFYFKKNNLLYFSSDLIGLSNIFNNKLNDLSVLSYLGMSYVPKPNTIFKDIHKLNPGSSIIIENHSKIKINNFWNLKHSYQNKISFSEAKHKLNQLLTESNNIQLRTDTDFAISLSGGIDSSLVLAYASLNYNDKLNTISMRYEGKNNSNDSYYSKKISKQFNTNHIEVNIKREGFLNNLDDLIPYIDEPISDSSLISNYLISKEARKKGIKVLLSGAGGDELFGGYHRHFKPSIFSLKGLTTYPKFLRNISYKLLEYLKYDKNNLRIKYPRLSFPVDIHGINYSFLISILKSRYKNKLLENLFDEYNDISLNDNYELSRMLNDSNNYLVDNILSLSDKSSMAASVEGRFPIIDYRIAELSFSLSKKMIFHNNEKKGFLKEVIKNYIPDEILNRKKEGYNAPMSNWFSKGDMKNIYKYIIESSEENLSSIIDTNILKKDLYSSRYRNNFENIYNLYFLNKWISFHGK